MKTRYSFGLASVTLLFAGCQSANESSVKAHERFRQAQANQEMLAALASDPRGAVANPYGRVGPAPDVVSAVKKEKTSRSQQQFERELGKSSRP